MKLFKNLLKHIWQSYLKLCRSMPWMAVPLPNGLAQAGRVWCHPEFFRHRWSSDEDKVFATLVALIKPGDVFFDVGANIGQTAIVGARCVGADGCVVAFEPSKLNVDKMEYHLRWNGVRQVKVETVCVGKRVGIVDFFLQGDGLHSSNSLTFSDSKNLATLAARPLVVKVPITTIDAYCAATGLRPDVIKIDVEGAELDVLQGALEVLKLHRPRILLGIHPFWWPEGQSGHDIGEFLDNLGYKVLNPGTRQEVRPQDFADYLCLPKESLA